MCLAVCDPVTGGVIINDYGDGTCAYSARTSGSCTFPSNDTIFGGNVCQTFEGDLLLIVENIETRPPSTYLPPTFDTWLNNVGLADLSTAGAYYEQRVLKNLF
jgi:hypothetical protein